MRTLIPVCSLVLTLVSGPVLATSPPKDTTPAVVPTAKAVTGARPPNGKETSTTTNKPVVPGTGQAAASKPRTYDLSYVIDLRPDDDGANATIRLGAGAEALREIRLRIDPDRHRNFEGDGEIRQEKNRLVWIPPRNGGELRYFAQISHRRDSKSYDARITDKWALFRGGDIFPPATVRSVKGSSASARLTIKAPKKWAAVTPYRKSKDGQFRFDHPDRRFDRPTGWMLVGKIGVRRANIANTHVAVAAPTGENARRMDTLALLRWNLPALRNLFPDFDKRLLIVSAGDPMWRGGLSGPASLFLHVDRPLISENATSTLLHELVHVAMNVGGSKHDDWIIEGLAEFYSVELLRRSGTIGHRRFSRTMQALKKWGSPVQNLFVDKVHGAVKARAVDIIHQLDAAIATASGGSNNIDHVTRALMEGNRPITYARLCIIVHGLAPAALDTLDASQIPGAPPKGCNITQ